MSWISSGIGGVLPRAAGRFGHGQDASAARRARREPGRAPRLVTGEPPLPAPARLHVVTGKGGTGKTTVAAALALALAADGRRTLLVEVEGRQGIAQLFDTAAAAVRGAPDRRRAAAAARCRRWRSTPRRRCWSTSTCSTTCGRAGRALRKMGAIDFATTIAPGLRDVLLTGKVKEAVTRTADGRRVYDAVVLDAPPTGRIGRSSTSPPRWPGWPRSARSRPRARASWRVLRSPQTAVHVVTLLEEMPVQETADAIAELTKAGLPVGSVIVNMAAEPLLPDRRHGPGRRAAS